MKKYILIIIVIIFSLDYIFKELVINISKEIMIIPSFLYVTLTKNFGIAFSLFSGSKGIIIMVTGLILMYLIYILKKETKNTTIFLYTIILAGLFGNLYDRIFRGYVVDYIRVSIFNYNFPIFNFSDIMIVIGAIFLILSMIKEKDYE